MNQQIKNNSRKAGFSLLMVITIFFSIFSTAAADDNNVTYEDGGVNSGRDNIIRIYNTVDYSRVVKGRIQVNYIDSQTVKPVNEANAVSSCQYCQSFAVALQIDFYNKSATEVSPMNLAIAVNYKCTHCFTAAWGYQLVIPVDRSDQVADDLNKLVKDMQKEINSIARAKNLTPIETANRLEAIANRFNSLTPYLLKTEKYSSENDS